MDRELLRGYGIDYDKGIKNCMGDVEFFKTILSMFLRDNCFMRAKAAYDARNYKELFDCMHEVKGVSGNAALVALYDTAAPLVELLRHGTDADADVDMLFSAVDTAYHRACEGIARFIAE